MVAGRGAPEWLGGLGRVTAGMGLRLVLGGEESFVWERSTEPTRGLVELRTGWNLVGWSGADGAPLEQVAKGIGWSLREVRRWDAANQRWEVWMSPERSAQLIASGTAERVEPVTVRRGEGLWVKAARAVNWLQPTGVLPRLVFPGGASDELRARVREDLEAVLAFYGQQYGIQADPDFTVYVAKDVEALIQAYKGDDIEVDDARAAGIRAQWNRAGGWAGGEIVVKQASWPEDLSSPDISWARYTLTHEYFHILQHQLSNGGANVWLSEGTATWAESDHQAIDSSSTWEDARGGYKQGITEDTPSLRSTESGNATWQYTLGWLAIDQLTASADSDSWIELWRQLAPTEIGPHGRWTSTPDWRTAFQEAFDVPVSKFYAEFNAWQREQAVANGPAASPSDDDTHWIRGWITDESGAPVGGVFVNAIRVEGETEVGWNQRAETNAAGVFAVRAPEDGDYRISVDVNDGCRRYYSDGELIRERDEAEPVPVVGSDLEDIDLQAPSNICRWFIRGQVVDDIGQPLAGVSVTACEMDMGNCTGSLTASDGSFAVSVATVGEYMLYLNGLTDGCDVYYKADGPTTVHTDASQITVTEANSSTFQFHVLEDMCAYRIRGRVTGSDGTPHTAMYTEICREVDNRCTEWIWRRTDADGSFAITAPNNGRYRVSFSLEGCSIHFHAGGLTTTDSKHSTVHVVDRDVRLSLLQVPAEMCARRISGRFVDADGAPLAGRFVQFNGSGGSGGLRTDADGGFELRVPSDGAYHFGGDLRDQPYCWHSFARQALGSPGNPVRVSGSDVTGVELRLPGTVEELCG